ncbi:MAG TPA: TadE/TadG family type IV pilus assembly protein [Pyrinomonadaceae bacterium]|nr:TadE/TadG family type IV pilus assembly protein [Pyrinomonadaceae bacterium]
MKIARGLKRFGCEERGAQLVELAIILPIFMFMFGAVAEFGRYFYEYTTLSKATRAGARYLISAKTSAQEDTIAKNIVVYGNPTGTGTPVVKGLTPGNVIVTRTGGSLTVPQTVTVEISGYKYQPAFDLGKMLNMPSLSLNVDVKPSMTMRYLLTQPLL